MPDPHIQRQPTSRIVASTGFAFIDLRAIWHHRDLLLLLAWRDILVRYKHTAIGIFWAILQPALMMLVFSLFFLRLSKVPSLDNVPYPIFSLAGLLPWQLFSTSATTGTHSLSANSHLIAKVFFPRAIVVLATLGTSLVDFLVSACFLGICLLCYHINLQPRILLLIPLTALLILLNIGVALWLSSLTIQFKDIRYVVPFAIQLGMFVSPVAYPATSVPEQWRIIYDLNPLSGIISGFRYALSVQPSVSEWSLICAIGVSTMLLVSGGIFFRRFERVMADRV